MTPNFFLVGAPKCGTTALSRYLREHPAVFLSRPKEPHFFASDFPGYVVVPSRAAYDDLFALASPAHQAIGEASVWYLFSEAAIPAIRRYNPDARLIVMLRNPLDMIPSLHSQLFHTYDEDEPDIAVAWELQAARAAGRRIPPRCREPAFLQYARVGRLGEQVVRLLADLPREQVKLIVFDDFQTQTRAVYEEALQFLGVESDAREHFPPVNENKRRRAHGPARLIERPPAPLVRMGRELASVTGLALGRSWAEAKRRLRRVNTARVRRPPLEPGLRAAMADAFRADVEALSELLDRDLRGWLQPEGIERPVPPTVKGVE
ncbi:MAG: sulfotransferase domain-containing protein [Gemmatimonadota bacterium]